MLLEEIAKKLSDYDAEGAKLWAESVDELFKKGFPNGVYQDYGVVADIASILGIITTYLKERFPEE